MPAGARRNQSCVPITACPGRVGPSARERCSTSAPAAAATGSSASATEPTAPPAPGRSSSPPTASASSAAVTRPGASGSSPPRGPPPPGASRPPSSGRPWWRELLGARLGHVGERAAGAHVLVARREQVVGARVGLELGLLAVERGRREQVVGGRGRERVAHDDERGADPDLAALVRASPDDRVGADLGLVHRRHRHRVLREPVAD